MATQLQIRRGTTAQTNSFTGAEGELSVNTTTDTVHVHDGSTAGGHGLAKADGSNIATYAGSFTTLAASGATTLSSTLAVTGEITANGGIAFGDNDKATFGAGDDLQIYHDGSNSYVKDSGNGDLIIQAYDDIKFQQSTDNADLVTINTGGNVGIGISPTKKLTVFGTGVGNATVQIEGEGGADPYINFLTNNAQHWSLGVDDSDSDKFKLSEHSALGTNDYLVVDVTGITTFTKSGGGNIRIAETASRYAEIMGYAEGSANGSTMAFSTIQTGTSTSTERMRLDSSGNLLAAGSNTNPVGNNVVGHLLGSDGRVQHSTTGNTVMKTNQTTDGDIVQFRVAGSALGSIGSEGGNSLYITNDDAGFRFSGGSNAIVPCGVNGAASDGLLNLGLSGLRYKDLHLAGTMRGNLIKLRQNAGSIYSSPTNSNTLNADLESNTDGADMWLNYRGYQDGFSRFRDLRIGNGKGAALVHVDGSAGSFAINASLRVDKSFSNNVVLNINNSSGTAPNGASFTFSATAPNNGTQTFFTTSDSSAYRGGWLSNGGIQNYQANNSNLSDRREKTNFAPAKSYLETICAIPVQTFNYIDQNMDDDDSSSLGVVAQDVQAVAPELVVENNWGTQDEPKMRLAIYQTDFQYALMKSIQELKEELDTATARIIELENN